MSSQQQGGQRAGAREDIAARLRPFVADAVGTLGFDLECFDVQVAGRRRLVKIVVDGDDGVELDLLAEVSRVVSGTLDQHEDVLAGSYTLEVTSPGVDRPLTLPRHWRRARLRLVRVRAKDGVEFVGRVGDAGDREVTLLVDGKLRQIDYATVAKATVEIEFRQPPAADLLLLEHGDDAEHGSDTGRQAEQSGSTRQPDMKEGSR